MVPFLGGGRREDGDGTQVARLLQEGHVPPQAHRLVPVGRADGAKLKGEIETFWLHSITLNLIDVTTWTTNSSELLQECYRNVL